MKDLLFFICFILIFLFGFSVTSWAFHIANTQTKWTYQPDGRLENVTFHASAKASSILTLVYEVTNFGIWKVFAAVESYGIWRKSFHFYRTISFAVEVTDLYGACVFILNVIFATISNIVLLNILIALFK